MIIIRHRVTNEILLKIEKPTGANLQGANLQGADLTGADLEDVNLRGANLQGADLTGADLTGAVLRDCYGEGKAIVSHLNYRWHVNVTATHMWIGCQGHAHQEWADFDEEQIAAMDKRALVFWHEHKDALLELCKQRAEQTTCIRQKFTPC